MKEQAKPLGYKKKNTEKRRTGRKAGSTSPSRALSYVNNETRGKGAGIKNLKEGEEKAQRKGKKRKNFE